MITEANPSEHMCPRRAEVFHQITPGPDQWEHRFAPLADGFLIRSCSYCGGVHPEDVLALMALGWDDEETDKSYKGYLNPPGTTLRNWRFTRRNELVPPEGGSVPTLKFYVPHFVELELLDALLDAATQNRMRNREAFLALPPLDKP